MSEVANADVKVSSVLPLELVDKCIGSRVFILMTDDREFTGTLAGFDDFVNMVLEDVVSYGKNQKPTKVKSMLLSGNQIAMIVPGGERPQ